MSGLWGGKVDVSPALYPTSILPYRVAPLGEPWEMRLQGQLRTPSGVGPGFRKLLCPLRGIQALRQVPSPDPGLLPLSTHRSLLPLSQPPKSQVPGRLETVLSGSHPSPKTGAGCSLEHLDGALLLPTGSAFPRPSWWASSVLFHAGFVLVGSWLVCWGFCFPHGPVG